MVFQLEISGKDFNDEPPSNIIEISLAFDISQLEIFDNGFNNYNQK